MISKQHKQNTNFQIAYFLVGSCHTADGAYALLTDLREDRQGAVDNFKVSELKNKAKIIRANKLLNGDEADRLEGQAELLEIENGIKTSTHLYQIALAELDFIAKCIAIVQPLRIYSHLSDSEANELAQCEEWKFELISRAENSLLTSGMIPTDQFTTMRLHPAFPTEILPRISQIQQLMQTDTGRSKLLNRLEGKEFPGIIKLLGETKEI